MLNITNGDSAVEIMKAANIEGVFLPWQDVLHDGPVPDNLSLEELSKVRAQFIIDCGWGAAEDIRQSFIARDNALKSFARHEKVILWFEHDLYDQLQILQILDWFHSNLTKGVKLSIICTERYLGMLSPDEMNGLKQFEEPIIESHLVLASKAWSAFRSYSPEAWFGLLNTDTSVLPFLEGAIVRVLEEYPDHLNGLSRTAKQALRIVSAGEKKPGKVFGRYQETEDRVFMGDASFWLILDGLLQSNPPLLNLLGGSSLTLPITPGQELSITPVGLDVLAGKRNWLDTTRLDRWIGGVHLESDKNIWCWVANPGSLIKRV